jgi:hypothetical protein
MLATFMSILKLDTLLEPSGLTEILLFTASFAILFVVLSVVFYLAGALVVGRSRALFKDAFAISVLGILVLIVCLSVFSLEVTMILSLLAWFLLVRHYFEAEPLGSIAISLTSVIIAGVILVALDMFLWNSQMLFRWLPLLL